MSKYAIVTDSTSDLSKELRAEYSIDYVQMNLTLNGKVLQASLDWDVFSPTEMYEWMREKRKITTDKVPEQAFIKCFEKYLSVGQDVLYIGCSSALSDSVNVARGVVEELIKKYPENKVVVVDSLISCMGQGILCIEAAKNRALGYSIDENKRWLLENRLKANQICSIETLNYLKNSGRIKASKAFFGNLLNLKPIIISDVKGNNYAIKTVRGRGASLDYILDYTKETIINPEDQIIYVSHGDDIEAAEFLAKGIKEAIHCKNVVICPLGPIIGACCGPGTVAIYYMGREVRILGEYD